jgi:hypothetical protein
LPLGPTGIEALQPGHDILVRLGRRVQVALRHDAIDSGIGDGFLEPQPLQGAWVFP